MTAEIHLVTGATGFSASHLIRELIEQGRRVVGTDLKSALDDSERLEVLQSFGFPLDHPNLELLPSDLLIPESLERLFEQPVCTVFHTASLYDYSAPLERLRRINVDGTANLIEAAIKAGVGRFVHWSTCGVFGKPYTTRQGALVNIPFTEECSSPKTEPFGTEQPKGSHLVNPYSVSKWEQEQLVWKAHREQGLAVTVIRPAPIYGPGSCYGHGGILLSIASGVVRGVPRDSKNYINASVHVDDVARFAVYAADREDTVGEDYNIVDSVVYSQYDFTHYLGLLTGRRLVDIPIVSMRFWRIAFLLFAWLFCWLERSFGVRRLRMLEPQSATYMGSSYWLSNRKSLKTGFKYRYPDVREGLADTVTWFREMGWLYSGDFKTRWNLLLTPSRRAKEDLAAVSQLDLGAQEDLSLDEEPDKDYAQSSR